jgi:hypothetical protein
MKRNVGQHSGLGQHRNWSVKFLECSDKNSSNGWTIGSELYAFTFDSSIRVMIMVQEQCFVFVCRACQRTGSFDV